MPAYEDRSVLHDDIELAVRDHGGTGRALLLLHGASRTLADWDEAAALLARRHRVVAMDIRAHGHSGDGAEWSFDAVLGDIAAVLSALALPAPVLVGHSLGGILATLYAARQDSPSRTEWTRPAGVVNLDGHWYGTPDQYPGLDPSYVTGRLREINDMAAAAAGRAVPSAEMEKMLAQQADMATTLGIPAARYDAATRRALATTPTGDHYLRPARPAALAMLKELSRITAPTLYRHVPVPTLAVQATRPNPPTIPWFDTLMTTYTTGLTTTLNSLAATTPHLTTAQLPTTHAMLLESPTVVATCVEEFAAGV